MTSTTPGAGREERLAPFGRAWAKVREAIEKRVAETSTEELHELREACASGRWLHELKGDDYVISFEVERQTLAELRRRGVRGL